MTGIVIELQQDALASSVSVSDLLRKAKVVALKLALSDAAGWIETELNGYPEGGSQPPAYREIHGMVKGHNPFHGRVPVMIEDARLRDAASRRRIGQSVAEIEALQQGKGPFLIYAPELEIFVGAPTYIEFPGAQLQGILDAVRNRILDWSLALEARGIVGEGLRFTPEERRAATEAASVINIYGPVSNANIQSQSPGSTQNLGVGTDWTQIRANLAHARCWITPS